MCIGSRVSAAPFHPARTFRREVAHEVDACAFHVLAHETGVFVLFSPASCSKVVLLRVLHSLGFVAALELVSIDDLMHDRW